MRSVSAGALAPAVFLSRSVCTSLCAAEEPIPDYTAFYLQEMLSKSSGKLFLVRKSKRSFRGALLKMAGGDLFKQKPDSYLSGKCQKTWLQNNGTKIPVIIHAPQFNY